MTKSQEIYTKAKEAGLTDKKEYIKFKGTGKHTLKFIKDEMFGGTNYRTRQPEKKMRYTFEEGGVEKSYETAVFKKDDNQNETQEPSNFVQQMNPFSYGDTIIAEYTPIEGTPKGFINVSEDIPTIQDDNEDPGILEEI